MTQTGAQGRVWGWRAVRWALLAAGIGLFAWVFHRAGPHQVWQDFLAQSWAIAPYIVLSGLENSLHTISCRRCVSPAQRSAIPWWRMFLLYHMAYALNSSTPTGDVGGDVARGVAMRRHIPGAEAASAVLVNKFTFSIARMGVAAGLTGMTLVAFQLDPAQAWIIGLGGALTALALLLFAAAQARGLLGPLLSRLARVAGKKAQESMTKHAAELDLRLRTMYQERRRDLLASIGYDGAGFLVGVLQRSILIAAVVGPEVYLPGRFLLLGGAVWGVTNLVEMIFFFVAGRLGVREGGYKAAFEAVGLPGEKGVLLSVIDRMDQLFWTILGFGVYWYYLLRSPTEKGAPGASLCQESE
jgi:hypothetical protein